MCLWGAQWYCCWLELCCHRLTHCLPSKHTVGRGKNAGLDLLVCVCVCNVRVERVWEKWA